LAKGGEAAVARTLLSSAAVRERAHEMLGLGVEGALKHWDVRLDRLPDTAAFVADVVRDRYPTLDVPFHARWRHFVVDGRDLWVDAAAARSWPDAAAKARSAFDLAITSVLLDAGSGQGWTYQDAGTGSSSARSEGLAVASLRMFQAGAFSSRSDDLMRADASALQRLGGPTLGRGFQVSETNPLVGVEGRAALLRRLGDAAASRPDLFGLADEPRPGGLFDAVAAKARSGKLKAPVILQVLLEALGPIWQGRLSLGAVPLGDCWRHPALRRADRTDQLVPLHKLSQWLAYSLVEPLEEAGIKVTDLDGLTGLAEYRNGGLFIDRGVLALRDPSDAERSWRVEDPLVVGWRAMTVALLDRLAPMVREQLGVAEAAFPLARVLEGGTWAAGRLAAKEQRPGGVPPLTIVSDGTVF
jgi:hypothetical protein